MSLPDLRALQEGDLGSREDHLYELIDRAYDGDADAAETLRAIVREPHAVPRGLVTRALNQVTAFGNAELEAPLQAVLEDHRLACEPWAAAACAQLGFKSAVPLLIPMLEHQDPMYREQAILALGELGDESVVPLLIPILGDHDHGLRENAAVALTTIGGPAAFDALWAELAHRRHQRIGHIASALATFAPDVIPDLVTMAEDGDADQRYWAAIALGSTGDESAVPTLERLAAEDDGETVFDGWVRVAAKKGLRTLRRIQAARATREAASEQEEQPHAG